MWLACFLIGQFKLQAWQPYARRDCEKMSVSERTQRNDPEEALSPEPGPVHQLSSPLIEVLNTGPFMMGWARESLGT